jgi:hypothetical protein
MRTVNNPHRLGRPIHIVAARAAVRMDVDKARADVAAPSVDHHSPILIANLALRTNRYNPVAFYYDHATRHEPRWQNHRASKYYAFHI